MSKSLNEHTYENLKKDIMGFVLPPGEGLSAQSVALRYGVSRTPAREAIVKLEQEGLLQIIPKSGTYVARINLRRARQEWFVRMNLEIGMVDYFISNCTDTVLQKMEEKLDCMKNYQEGDSCTRIDLDNDFHDIIYTCSGQELAREIIHSQMTHYNRIRFLAELSRTVNIKSYDEHKELLEAAKNKDAKQFTQRIRNHVWRIEQERNGLIIAYPEYFEE